MHRSRPDSVHLAAELLDVVGQALGGRVGADPDWRPPVQGAVGHVVGARAEDGTPYAVKFFPHDAHGRADTEVRALELAGPVLGQVVPKVEALGELPSGAGRFVVLSRVDGTRWADRRADLTAAGTRAVLIGVAQVLRRLHGVVGDAHGDLLQPAGRHTSTFDHVESVVRRAVTDHVESDGDPSLSDVVADQVRDGREAFEDVVPVLCHHDLNGGNVLVSAAADPVVTGVVDFERAAWDDPMHDVALTALHVLHHEPAMLEVLLDAYGALDGRARRRLRLWILVRAMRERAWVITDRPPGWEQSAATLEARIRAWLADADLARHGL